MSRTRTGVELIAPIVKRWSPLCLILTSCSGGAISESPFLDCGTALAYVLSPKRRYGKRFMVSGV